MVEGRHISGRNINPVVRVTVGGIKKQTQVKYTTNQPYYNQVRINRSYNKYKLALVCYGALNPVNVCTDEQIFLDYSFIC